MSADDKIKEILEDLVNWVCEGDLEIAAKTDFSLRLEDEDGDLFDITITKAQED